MGRPVASEASQRMEFLWMHSAKTSGFINVSTGGQDALL